MKFKPFNNNYENISDKNLTKFYNCYCDKNVDNNSEKYVYKREIVWRNVISLSLLHIGAIYGFSLGLDPQIPWYSFLLVDFIGRFSAIGVLAGSHRLWCHRSYKARLPLRILLMIMNTMSLQNDIYEWSRDHRTHHKFSETDADPHNSRRGFFFAHMGWLLVRKHPEVIRKGKTVDMSDIWADPVVRFQRRFYIPLVIIFWALVPTYLAHKVLNVPKWTCFFGIVIFRYIYSLHSAWLVNSAAHLYGDKLYDMELEPRENRYVVFATLGEGYHNYHHTFPWDYSASEMSWKFNYNPTTAFIDLCALLGLAYDLKKPDQSVIKSRIGRTGDEVLHNKFFNNFNVLLDPLFGFLASTWAIWLTMLLRIILNGQI